MTLYRNLEDLKKDVKKLHGGIPVLLWFGKK